MTNKYIKKFIKEGIDKHATLRDSNFSAWSDMVYMYSSIESLYNENRKLRKELKVTSKKLPKLSGNMPKPVVYDDGRVTGGNVLSQAGGSKKLSYNDGRTSSGNVKEQANQPVGKKLYPDTPGGPEGYSLGSLTKKEVH